MVKEKSCMIALVFVDRMRAYCGFDRKGVEVELENLGEGSAEDLQIVVVTI